VRLVSNKLSDTKVELLTGSAILESTEARSDNSVVVLHKKWQVKAPQNSVYRIDADPAQLEVYKGKIEVSTANNDALVAVKEGECVPLADVLLPEKAVASNDPFKNWAMSRSQTIIADNNTAANIIDDPNKLDTGSLDGGDVLAGSGLTYFPPPGISPLGLSSPYGVSFWSPYQSTLSSVYFSPYMYGVLYPGWPTARYYSSPIVRTGALPARGSGGVIVPGRSGMYSPGTIITPRGPSTYVPPTRSTPIGAGIPPIRSGAPHIGVGAAPAAPHVAPHVGAAGHAVGHR
jgi:hypothetical protein